jgi:PAS domain S-box-containing protein
MVTESVIDTTANKKVHENESMSILKIPHIWYITTIMILCSVLYYLDIIMDLVGQPTPGWNVFLITHDFYLFFFSVPMLYAGYVFRVKGIITTGIAALLIFIPRAALNTSYLEPFNRAVLFTSFIFLLGILIAYVQNRRIQIAEAYTIVKQHAEKLMIAETAIKACVSAIATTNLEGDLTYVNPAFLKIWGYKNSEEILAKNFASLCNEEDKINELIQTLQITKETEAAELVGKRKDGKKFIVGLKASLITDTEGKPIGITASMADITNRLEKPESKQTSITESK